MSVPPVLRLIEPELETEVELLDPRSMLGCEQEIVEKHGAMI